MYWSRAAPPPSALRAVPAAWLPLPRVRAGSGPAGPVLSAGALLLLASVGAALVHVVEYHLGLDGVNGRPASVAFMLAHCPVRGGLLVVIAAALLTLLALFRELQRLAGQRHRLTQTARCLHVAARPPAARAPLHPGRLLALLLPLLGVQAGLYALAEQSMPMTVSTHMHGVVMAMAVQSAVPLLPVHLAVALLLAALVWRLERRFETLQAAITALRRLLSQALQIPLGQAFPPAPPLAPSGLLGGPGVLSRPPPI